MLRRRFLNRIFDQKKLYSNRLTPLRSNDFENEQDEGTASGLPSNPQSTGFAAILDHFEKHFL